MLIISHRGNLQGPSPFENQPSQIDICLEAGFDCEIDLRVENDELFLGHDSGQYKITQDWLFDRKEKLWIHCKNFNAIALMQSLRSGCDGLEFGQVMSFDIKPRLVERQPSTAVGCSG